MAKPGFKFSGLVKSGKVTLDPSAKPSDAFAPPDQEPLPEPGVEFTVDLDILDDSPFQKMIRRVLDPQRIDEIGSSMDSKGQSTPVTVRRKENGRYELIKGHYRKYSAKSIGWTQLRALLVVATDRQAKRDLMLDNEGTLPTEWEYAHMFREAKADGEAETQSDLARMFGCSQAKVSICLGMLELPPEIHALLDAKPSMLGATAAKVVTTLWAEYPTHHAIILDSVSKLADGAEQSSIRKTVEAHIAALQRKAEGPKPRKPPQQPRRAVIKGHTGVECYVTILKENAMTVEFKDSGIDRQLVQDTINKALKDLVASSPKADDEK